MSAHATIEELEALLRGELDTARSAAIDAHLADCESCHDELAWLRAERSLLHRRPRPPLPPALWRNIESQLPATVQPLVAPRQNRRRSQTAQWFAVAAAAAAMLAVVSLGGLSLARLRQGVEALLRPTGAGTQAGMMRTSSPPPVLDDEPPVVVTLPVSGAVTLRLSTLSADIEAVAGARDKVLAEVSESPCKKVELRREGPALHIYFDGVERLDSGHLRLELPPGSRLEASTVSGSLHSGGLDGDVRLQTASGDVELRDARRVEIESASGDIQLANFSGEARISTASGDAHVTRGAAPLGSFNFKSASGELTLEGECGNDCRVHVETVSGDVELRSGPAGSYTAQFHTVSGDLDGHKPDADDEKGPSRRNYVVRRGSGVGQISVTTVSGDLSLGPQ